MAGLKPKHGCCQALTGRGAALAGQGRTCGKSPAGVTKDGTDPPLPLEGPELGAQLLVAG